MKKINYLFVGILVLLTASCATPIKEEQRSLIKTIGIINKFPDEPTLTQIGTTVFTNKINNLSESGMKNHMNKMLISILKSHGYDASVTAEGADDDRFDMVITLVPRDVYDVPVIFGYGFYQRFLLGASITRKSYIALNMIPEINGKTTCSACYAFNQSDIPFATMVESWDELVVQHKEMYLTSLKKDIDSALEKLVTDVGL